MLAPANRPPSFIYRTMSALWQSGLTSLALWERAGKISLSFWERAGVRVRSMSALGRRLAVTTLKASNVIAVGNAHGSAKQKDLRTLKGSKNPRAMCDPFRVDNNNWVCVPGAMPPAIKSQPFRLPDTSAHRRLL